MINCIADSEQPFWSIELANDSTGTQHQFSSREDLLNDHGVYELPQIETPGMSPTLRLFINDTIGNKSIVNYSTVTTSISTTLFTIGKYRDYYFLLLFHKLLIQLMNRPNSSFSGSIDNL